MGPNNITLGCIYLEQEQYFVGYFYLNGINFKANINQIFRQ